MPSAAACYVANVSAIVTMSPHDILWLLPLADGLFYQCEKWRRDGLILRRTGKREVLSAKKYF